MGLAGDMTNGGGGWISFGTFPRRVGDVNGDGKADLVGFGSSHGGLFYSDGTQFVGDASNAMANVASSSCVESVSGSCADVDGKKNPCKPKFLEDVNGDGNSDLICTGSDGTIYVSLAPPPPPSPPS